MKKIILPAILAATCMTLRAQSVEEGNRQLYYERYQLAEQTFHQVLNREPENAAAWYGLTRAELMQDKVMKLGDTIRMAPAAVLQDPYYQVAYGSVLLYLDKKDSASPYFEQALKKTREKDPGILAAIATVLITSKSGDALQAAAYLNKAIKRDKHNASLYVLLGDAYLKSANGSEAYKAYRDAIDENGKYAAAYHRIGEIFRTQKNADLYLEYFNKSIQADPDYAPSLYQLYVHYFYHDPVKALQYYNQYLSKADTEIKNEYELADLYYLNKDYEKAIQKAQQVITQEKDPVHPRLFKLLGYSYAGLKDTLRAVTWMNRYFSEEQDSNLIAKDYESMANFYEAREAGDSAAFFYTKAVDAETDSATLFGYYKKLAALSGELKDYTGQAKWLSRYYNGNDKATNLDLFNWGLAHYRAEEYKEADSVFGAYMEKYPEQSFGYYWRARSNVALDKEMVQGLAVPYYQKLVEVLATDTSNTNYKKWMVEAYGYLAAYEANQQKDYKDAIGYFEKILEVDPENENARKYIAILEKNEGSK